MGSTKALTLATFIAIGLAQGAQAADLPPAPMLDEPNLRGPVEESGFYLRADTGIANTNASALRSSFADGSTLSRLGAVEGPVNVGDPAMLGLGVGYQVTSWFRVDLTGEYRSNIAYHASSQYKFDNINALGVQTSPCPASGNGLYSPDPTASTACGDEYSGGIKTSLFLANGYFDLGTWYGLTPYVGAGIGAAVYQVAGVKDTGLYPVYDGSFGFAQNHTGTNFAWALMAGASYSLTDNLKLDIGYRYANMGRFSTGAIACNYQAAGSCHYETQSFNMASNDIRVGLRWMLTPPEEPVAPIRAKY